MKRTDAFPSSYLGKTDVQTPLVAVIENVEQQMVKGDDGESLKPIIHFGGNLKPMILNNTNWMAIEDAYGDESDNWRGKRIELYFDPSIMFGAKRVGGVRVRVPSNGHAAPAGTPTGAAPVTLSPKAEAYKCFMEKWTAFASERPSEQGAEKAKAAWLAVLAEVFGADTNPQTATDGMWQDALRQIRDDYIPGLGICPV